MKICKNHFDIIVHPVEKCSQCALRTRRSPCLWLRVVGTHCTLNCGGVRLDGLSDIFKICE